MPTSTMMSKKKLLIERLPSNKSSTPRPANLTARLQPFPHNSHVPEDYSTMSTLEYPSTLYAAMENYLPEHILNAPRKNKALYIDKVLAKYRSDGKRARRRREYKERVRQNYQPLHRGLYSLNPTQFFSSSFLEAVKLGTSEALCKVLTQLVPGVYTLDLLQPGVCGMILEEVEHFERWAADTNLKIVRLSTMSKYGAVLEDMGMDKMLKELMNKCIIPLASEFFQHMGGATLDSHHGFVVEYGPNRNISSGLHVDDSEVTLNVCLGKSFEGSEQIFRGVRCDKHVDSETRADEKLEYVHIPGHAILHSGRHRHGAKAIKAGQRSSLIMWCRSSAFRELKKYQHRSSSWCEDCSQRKKEKIRRLTRTKVDN